MYETKTEESKKIGRIVHYITIENVAEPSKKIQGGALVDTGASMMVLPSAWKERLGKRDVVQAIKIELANQQQTTGEISGPVRIQLEGFRPVSTGALFVEMKPENGEYEPLIGYNCS